MDCYIRIDTKTRFLFFHSKRRVNDIAMFNYGAIEFPISNPEKIFFNWERLKIDR